MDYADNGSANDQSQTDQSDLNNNQGDSGDSQQPQQQQMPDYSKNFEEINNKYDKLTGYNQQLLSDLQATKQELSSIREQERRRTLLMAGDQNIIKEERDSQRTQQIKAELLKVMPELGRLSEAQAQQANQSSVAEMAFYNQARTTARESLTNRGIKDQTAQDIVIRLGDALIHDVPQWHERFYKQGDTNVLREVEGFIFQKIFDPIKEQAKQETIEMIRKQGRFAAPIPQRSGGGSQQPQKKSNVNPDSRDDRMAMWGDVYRQTLANGE